MRIAQTLVCCSMLILAGSVVAQQQEGRQGQRQGRMRMPQLSQEQAQATWTWQAQGVARELQLSSAQTRELVKAYIDARAEMQEAIRAAREEARQAPGEGQGAARQGRGGWNREAIEAYRAALAETVDGILPAKQAEQATEALSLANVVWDRMVHGVLALELSDDDTYAAVAPIRQYVVRMTAVRDVQDRQARRDIMRETRVALNEDLEAVLTAEQLEQFSESIGRRGRQRGGEGPRRQRDGDGQADATGIGEAAPAFTLTDSNGAQHALSDYLGRVVVLQWINPDCPVCRRTSESGKVAAMLAELRAIDPQVAYLAINSTHYMEPAVSASYLGKHKIDAPVLIDRDGTVGHLFDAKRTPHLYVVDAKGVLRYQGAIDDDPHGDKGEAATNYVVGAVRQIAAGETVAPDVTKAYGCTVKYAQR